MESRIVSLCCVSNINEKTTELCRIADYSDGNFTPYTYDPRRSFYENERDLLYGSTAILKSEAGAYGVFEWNVLYTGEGQWWTEVDKRNDINWIEVILLEENSIPGIIKAVKNGLEIPGGYDGKHDLVLCARTYAAEYASIYLTPNEVTYQNSRLFFDNEVSSVKIGKTKRNLVATGKCRYSSIKMKNYLVSSEGFLLERRYVIKTTAEIVNEVIRSNINRFIGDAYTRKEKKLVRDALSRLADISISDILMERLKCNHNEAQQYIREFVETANVKLDDTTATSFIETLIENDSDAVQKLYDAVQNQWHSEHEQDIAQAQKEINSIREEQGEIHIAIEKEKEDLERIRNEEQQIRQKVKEAEKLYLDIQQKIQERLQHVREDMAGALIDYSLMGRSYAETSNEQGNQNGFIIPASGTTNNLQKESVVNSVLEAEGYWMKICGRTRWAESLSLLTAALFAANQSVIISGEGAAAVADTMATTIYGHTPLKLIITNPDSLLQMAHVIEQNNHDVICISDGLGKAYSTVRELMNLFPDSRFILTVLHEEMLSMEPESFYSSFFPIRSDYFYNGNKPEEFSDIDCTEQLLDSSLSVVPSRALKEARAKTERWFSDGYYSPLFRNRFARIYHILNQIGQKAEKDKNTILQTEIEFLVIPWIRPVSSGNHLETAIMETNLDPDVKEELLTYLNARSM